MYFGIFFSIEFAEFIGYTESQVLSDDALPVYVRQLAIHANVNFVFLIINRIIKFMFYLFTF